MIVINAGHIVGLQTKYGLINVFKGDDPIGTCLHYFGEWADQEFDVIPKLINDGVDSCCIDVGSNVGTHTLWMAKTYPNKYTISIEPQFYIFMLLNSNIVLNNCFNVIPIRALVANTNDKIKMNIMDPRGEKINYGEFNINQKSEFGFPVNRIKLDSIDYQDKKVDFIKMDCEGTETEVLLSAEKIITNDRPNMYIEFNGLNGNDEVLRQVKDYGYNCYWHVYDKFNPNNFNSCDKNIWISDGEKCHKDNIPKFFESNMICVHSDKDDGRFSTHETIEIGDGLTNYVIRNNLLEE